MSVVRWIGTGVAGLGLVGAGMTGLAFDDDTTRDESGEITEAGDVGAFRIRLGDCMVDPGEGTIESVEAVPCDEPHDLEIYHAFNLVGAEYPDDIDDQASSGCYNVFEPFVGERYETSLYDFMVITPTAESWEAVDDREVLCALSSWDGTSSTGSARATAR